MGKPGRKKIYGTAKELERAVDAYWNSISYEEPAVISTPTGEVDENGRIKYATKMLTVNEDGSVNMDGTGKPKTITKYLDAPTFPGLWLFLGITKQTWSQYSKDEKLGPVCEKAKLRIEAYLAGRLEGEKGKSVQGIMFNLEYNFGWQKKDHVEHSGGVQIEMAPDVRELAE